MGRDSVSRYDSIVAALLANKAVLLAKEAVSVCRGWCPLTVLRCSRFVYWREDVAAHAVLWRRMDI